MAHATATQLALWHAVRAEDGWVRASFPVGTPRRGSDESVVPKKPVWSNPVQAVLMSVTATATDMIRKVRARIGSSPHE